MVSRLKIDGPTNVVILGISDLSRAWHESAYDPEDPLPPTCWSLDTISPAPDVPANQAQARRCMECNKSIKNINGTPCKLRVRMAVIKEDNWNDIYWIQLASGSIFGSAKHGSMPLQAYIKYLQSHSTDVDTVVTRVYQDTDSQYTKYFFRAVKMLDEGEIKQVNMLQQSTAYRNALMFSLPQAAPEFTSVEGFTFTDVDTTL